mgnify:CR=1 FL=1
MPLHSYFKGHGEKVMASMNKTYGAEKAKQVFYATARKKKGLKEHTAEMARKGKLRMK